MVDEDDDEDGDEDDDDSDHDDEDGVNDDEEEKLTSSWALGRAGKLWQAPPLSDSVPAVCERVFVFRFKIFTLTYILPTATIWKW